MALWKKRRERQSAVISELQASQLQQRLKQLLTEEDAEGGKEGGRGGAAKQRVEVDMVAEIASATCALAVTSEYCVCERVACMCVCMRVSLSVCVGVCACLYVYACNN